MNYSKIISAFIMVSFFGLALSGVAFGQIANIPGVTNTGITTVGGIMDVIKNVIRWIYILFFIIAVALVLMAAFTYLTAGGDSEKVKEAKNRIIYAAVAIVVALLSVALETIITNFLTNPSA